MSYGLKGKFSFQLAILILAAMLLLEFASIIINQRDLIASLISRGNSVIAGLQNFRQHVENKDAFEMFFHEYLKSSDLKGGIIIEFGEEEEDILSNEDLENELYKEIRRQVLYSISNRVNKISYWGSTWGIYWDQKRYLIMSASFDENDKIKSGAGIVFELDTLYEQIRKRHALFTLYIILNTLIITALALKQLSRYFFTPMNSLIENLEKYREDDNIPFFPEKGNNEFQKLSNSMNSMLIRIGKNKHDLKEAVKSLEKANLDLKIAQKEIIKAEKMASTGRLSSGIAHEIGNPIAIVLGYLELLKQNGVSTDEKFEFIDRSIREIERVKVILRQLLDFSRDSSEKLEHTCIHNLLRDVLDVLQYHSLFSKIQVTYNLNAKHHEITTNEDHLRQVFLNVLLNASDSIKSKAKTSEDNKVGKIAIESKNTISNQNQELIEISIIDNGTGISEQNMDIIFDAFFTTKEPGEGTGLGLFVSYMIMEKLGGEIRAETIQNKGAKICITMPI